MTLRSSGLQSDSDLDSIRNSCDVYIILRLCGIGCMVISLLRVRPSFHKRTSLMVSSGLSFRFSFFLACFIHSHSIVQGIWAQPEIVGFPERTKIWIMLTYSDSAIVLPWVSPIKLKKSLKTTGDLLWVFEDGAIWINVMQAKSGYNLTSPCLGVQNYRVKNGLFIIIWVGVNS